jgi:hypothetical protein
MPDGHCASASEVVYAIQPTTSSCTAADGSLAMPFCTAQAAVDVARVGTKPIVVLRGAFGNVSASATTGQVTVVGQSGAMINPGANIYGVDVSGTSNVYIRDLTISGGTSTSGAAAHVSGTAATLTLLSVQMNGNVGGGVVAEGGATIVMDRCVVTGTGFGAPADLKTTASAFKITNCVFANSSSGAVLDSPPPGGSEIFKNNDLLANGTGLQCLASFASGLILYGNTTDTGLGCTVAPCCTGNPMLTSDYHLMSGSPCIDQLTPDPQVPDDIDGQSRPYPVGGKSDCGADEYEP